MNKKELSIERRRRKFVREMVDAVLDICNKYDIPHCDEFTALFDSVSLNAEKIAGRFLDKNIEGEADMLLHSQVIERKR